MTRSRPITNSRDPRLAYVKTLMMCDSTRPTLLCVTYTRLAKVDLLSFQKLVTGSCRVSHRPLVERIFVPKISRNRGEKTNKKKNFPGRHIIPLLKGISSRDSFCFKSDECRPLCPSTVSPKYNK